ncbi:hypothetical protein ACRRTK_011593 [Alexandromys fortis]
MPGAGSYERHDVITKACQNLYCDDKIFLICYVPEKLKIPGARFWGSPLHVAHLKVKGSHLICRLSSRDPVEAETEVIHSSHAAGLLGSQKLLQMEWKVAGPGGIVVDYCLDRNYLLILKIPATPKVNHLSTRASIPPDVAKGRGETGVLAFLCSSRKDQKNDCKMLPLRATYSPMVIKKSRGGFQEAAANNASSMLLLLDAGKTVLREENEHRCSTLPLLDDQSSAQQWFLYRAQSSWDQRSKYRPAVTVFARSDIHQEGYPGLSSVGTAQCQRNIFWGDGSLRKK